MHRLAMWACAGLPGRDCERARIRTERGRPVHDRLVMATRLYRLLMSPDEGHIPFRDLQDGDRGGRVSPWTRLAG